MYEYEGTRRISYPDRDEGEEFGPTFVPVCVKCGRFVKADATVGFGGPYGHPVEPNASCSRCGRTSMVFEGYL